MSVNWRYWRLRIDSVINPARGLPAIEYLKLTSTAGGATILTGGTASASSEFNPATSSADKAFIDNNVWWGAVFGGIPAWLQYDLGAGNAATARYLEFRPYTPDFGYAPKLFHLLGSNDGSTWTNLFSAEITDYLPRNKFVILTDGTVRIPFGYIVSGNGTHSDTTAVQRVFINDWVSGQLIDSVVPDVAGDWQSTLVATNDVLVTQIGDSGYQAISDGPITPAAR